MVKRQRQEGRYQRSVYLKQHSKYVPQLKSIEMGKPRAPVCTPQYECPACPKRFHLPNSMWKHFTTQHPYQAGRVRKYSVSPSERNCPRSLQYRCRKDCPLKILEGRENQTTSPPLDLACLPYSPWRSHTENRSKRDTTSARGEDLERAFTTLGDEGEIDSTWKALCRSSFHGLKLAFYKNRSRIDWRRPYLINTVWGTDTSHPPFLRKGMGTLTRTSVSSPLFGLQLTSTASQGPVDMCDELSRLSSYMAWTNVPGVSPVSLAKAGLYFVGPGDAVQCAFCNEKIAGWVCIGDPRKIHETKFLRSCPFALGLVTSNIPIHPREVREVLGYVVSENPVKRAAAIVLATMGWLPSIRLLQYAIGDGTVSENNHQQVIDVLPCIEGGNGFGKKTERSMAPSEVDVAERRLSLLINSKKCKICFSEDIETILLPCRHLVCCSSCSTALREPRRCPVCRRAVKQAFRAYIV